MSVCLKCRCVANSMAATGNMSILQHAGPPLLMQIAYASFKVIYSSPSVPGDKAYMTDPAALYMQKSFGKCSADFMKKGSRSSPFAPNGYCCITCGSCSCNSAQTSSRPTTSQSPSRPSTAQSPSRPAAQVPHPPVLATIAPRSPRLSPVTAATAAASLSPRASPSNAATSSPRAPPAPLSAAYLANCECTDVPPADASSCAAVVSSPAACTDPCSICPALVW